MLFRHAVTLLTSMLAIGMLVHALRQRSYGLKCLAAWMASLAACAWVIVLSIGPDRRMTAVGLLLMPLLSTPAGPLLLGYVLHALHGQRLHPAWFAPFAVHLAAALLLGTGLNRWISLTSVIWLEYACLLFSWWVWARSGAAARDRIGVASVLAAVTALQLANALQTLAVLGVIDMTPMVRLGPFYVVSAWSLGAIVFALLESPSLRRLAPTLVPTADAADRELFARLQEIMGEGQPWARQDFDVAALARLAGTHPNAVSRALARAGDTTFYDFVNGYRLREVERLLADPRESRIKIEALGRQAGFKARSTFFKLFRQHTGQTPSEYRATRTASPSGSQSSPSAP